MKADEVNGLDEAAEHPVDTQDLLFDGDFAPLPEDVGFYDDMTGVENLMYTAALNGIARGEAHSRAAAGVGRPQNSARCVSSRLNFATLL